MTGKRTREDIKEATPVFEDLAKDVKAGVDAISRFSEANWWAWKKGSALFFWRWPEGEQR
jgi:hypothetical protein